MAPAAGLEAGLFVGAEDVVQGSQGFAWPPARIEVQNGASCVGEVGITWRKIPYLYRHGLMASVARIRHTVRRLIGVPSTVRARAAACQNASSPSRTRAGEAK